MGPAGWWPFQTVEEGAPQGAGLGGLRAEHADLERGVGGGAVGSRAVLGGAGLREWVGG